MQAIDFDFSALDGDSTLQHIANLVHISRIFLFWYLKVPVRHLGICCVCYLSSFVISFVEGIQICPTSTFVLFCSTQIYSIMYVHDDIYIFKPSY